MKATIIKPKCYGKHEYFSLDKCFGSKCKHWMGCLYDRPQPSLVLYAPDAFNGQKLAHKTLEKLMRSLNHEG